LANHRYSQQEGLPENGIYRFVVVADVGGYGCGFSQPNESPYMKELIVRWYQVRRNTVYFY
jgi:hypothetical protein